MVNVSCDLDKIGQENILNFFVEFHTLQALTEGSLPFLWVGRIGFGKCWWRTGYKKSGLKLTDIVICRI